MLKGVKNSKGVTMIELLAALVIMGMLFGIAVPAISNNIKKTRDQTYVNDAMKLISNAEYQLRKDNTMVRPTKSRCVVLSLVHLNNGVFDEAPNGGDYLRNQSFVVMVNNSSTNETMYYVRLVEDMGSGSYRGIDYVTKTDLGKADAHTRVTNLSGSNLFKVAGSTNAAILNKVKSKISQCNEVYVYAPNSGEE